MLIETVKEILAGATSACITCTRVREINFLETAKMLVFSMHFSVGHWCNMY